MKNAILSFLIVSSGFIGLVHEMEAQQEGLAEEVLLHAVYDTLRYTLPTGQVAVVDEARSYNATGSDIARLSAGLARLNRVFATNRGIPFIDMDQARACLIGACAVPNGVVGTISFGVMERTESSARVFVKTRQRRQPVASRVVRGSRVLLRTFIVTLSRSRGTGWTVSEVRVHSVS